jgi:hypothetical protein
MAEKLRIQLMLLICAAVLAGCAETHQPLSANGGLFRQKNEGYSLLYKLMSDESKVGQIFIIKHADPSVGNLVKQIGDACKSAQAKMEQFPQKDPRMEYDVADLPFIEQKSRDLAAHADTKALLESSGKTFELRLLFTQAQAMSYGRDLCDALADDEDDPLRKAFLTNVSRQCGQFYDSLMDLLAVKT